jgi:hypothetical protein
MKHHYIIFVNISPLLIFSGFLPLSAILLQMHPNLRQASENIRHYLEHGVPEMHIREHFMSHGWSNEWFEQALQHARTTFGGATAHEPQVPQHGTQSPPVADHSQVQVAEPSRKYRVFRAIKDYAKAVKARPREYFSAAGAGIAAYVVSLIPVGLLIGLIAWLKPHGILLGILVLLAILLFIAWYAFATTFFMVITSWVLAAGHSRKAVKFGQIFRDALERTPRAAVTVAVASVITFLPLFLTVFIVLMAAFASLSGNFNPGALVALSSLMMLVSFIWILIASLRLALVQQVAVFEPHLTLRQSLRRSSYLLSTGGFVNNGQWFLLKGCLLLVGVNIILSLFTHASLRELQNTNNIFLNLAILIVTFVAQGVLAMLYFNRAAVLGNGGTRP